MILVLLAFQFWGFGVFGFRQRFPWNRITTIQPAGQILETAPFAAEGPPHRVHRPRPAERAHRRHSRSLYLRQARRVSVAVARPPPSYIFYGCIVYGSSALPP